jgi:hypothetical protein
MSTRLRLRGEVGVKLYPRIPRHRRKEDQRQDAWHERRLDGREDGLIVGHPGVIHRMIRRWAREGAINVPIQVAAP